MVRFCKFIFQEQERQGTPSSYELFTRTYQAQAKDGFQWATEKAKAIRVSC